MRKLVGVLSLALVATAAASVWLWRELHAERGRNSELTAQLQQRGDAPHPVLTAPDAAPAKLAQDPGAPPVPQATAATAQNTEKGGVVPDAEDQWRASQRRLFEDPRYREAWMEQRRLNYAPRRANLIRLVGLSPEQADAVINVQLDQEILWMSQPKDPNRDFAAQEATHQSRLTELIGEQKRQRLAEYMESRQSRMQVDRFRGELTEANVLRDDQVEPLIAAMHAERVQMYAELNDYRNSMPVEAQDGENWRLYAQRETELMEDANKRIRTAAGGILTQGQMKALDEMLSRDLAQQRSRQRMQHVQSKMAASASPGD